MDEIASGRQLAGQILETLRFRGQPFVKRAQMCDTPPLLFHGAFSIVDVREVKTFLRMSSVRLPTMSNRACQIQLSINPAASTNRACRTG